MKRAEREGKEDLSQFTGPNPACAYHRTHDLWRIKTRCLAGSSLRALLWGGWPRSLGSHSRGGAAVAVVPAPSKWNRRPTGASSDRLPQVGDGRSAGRIDKELEERL